jgi:hypothetical protein
MLNETVNPATGAVSVRVRVPVPPARGLTVPFSFGYDSNAAFHLVSGAPTDNFGYLSQGGWSYDLPRITIQGKLAIYPNSAGGGPYQCHYYTDYTFTDLQGANHALGISAVQPADTAPQGSCVYVYGYGYMPVPTIAQGGDATVQAVTTPLGRDSNTGPTPVTVADMDGVSLLSRKAALCLNAMLFSN